MRKRWIITTIVLALVALVAWPRLHSTFKPPTREGPAWLVTHGNDTTLWLLTRQEEERSRHVGGSNRMRGRWVSERYLHFRLQAHGDDDAQRRWISTLRVVKEDMQTSGAQSRLFGQQGEVVWLWLVDGPVALRASDAGLLADRATIERINPGLVGQLPRELTFYAWVGDLVVTLADGRPMRLRATDFVAEPFNIANEEAFRTAGYMSTTWNGLYKTEDFGVRAGLFDDRWIGLFSAVERADAIADGFGDNYRNADSVRDEGFGARRSFWLAKAGRTREFSEGSHPRIEDLVAVDGGGTYLEGRLLKAPGVPGAARGTFTRTGIWQAAVREPLKLDGGGSLVLFNTRIDAEGRLALARLDGKLHEQWRAVLPFKGLGARWLLPGRLLLYGGGDYSRPGMGDVPEAIIAIDLATGAWKGWDVAAEMPASAPR